MVPQGPSAPLGGSQPGPPSLLRSGSGMLSRQGSGMPSQNAFPSLVSPHNQFSNLNNMLGSNNNVSSLLHQSSFVNGPTSSGPGSSQRGLMDGGAESGPNGMGFNNPSSSSYMSGQVQGQQQFLNSMLTDQQQSQQLEQHSFQHNNQQSQQFQTMRAGLGGAGPVKMEPQMTNEQASQQQYQALRNMGSVKMEPQQLQSMRGLGPVKLEPQHSDPSFLHQQQQQQQQQMMMSRQSSQAAAAAQILHQQRFMQIQDQQQQQQLLKSMPQQRPQQFQQQNLPVRSPVKPVYEPGMCARRLTHYMYQQQHRPEDNSIEFWRKFVAEYFAPNARKKWCVSMYGSGRQTTGVFPQDVWHCEICNRKPGRGFEATVEVLPRLYKIKYESGTLEELLYVDMPREYQNPSGQIVLDYAKAIQESVFDQLRVVRDGQLRIVFSPDLKICSWEFCARRHEELIPRRILVPQVSQLGTAAQKYQAATQNTSSPGPSVPELQNNCNMFVASARQLVKTLEVPLVNDLGYTKRYVRCLQISEVVNSMKDLIDYNRDTGVGPMESLAKYPRRTNSSPSFRGQSQQPESQQQQQQQQQTTGQISNNGNSAQPAHMQLASTSAHSTPIHSGPTTSSNNNIANLVHQNSMNSRQQNPISNMNASYGGNSVQMPSPGGSSNTMPHNNNPSPSPFQSPTPSSSNNNNNIINSQPTSQNNTLSGAHINSVNSPNISIQQQPVLSNEADPNDSQSSVQKIINDMMMSSQIGGDMKINNRDLSTSGNPGNILLGTGVANGNHNNIGVSGFGGIQNRLVGQSGMVNGNRMAFVNNNNNNSLSMNGRVGMQTMGRDQRMINSQQQDMNNQLLSSLGAANGFNNLQFDWKASP